MDKDDILATRRRVLEERKAKTPLEALRALASMQARPQPVMSTITDDCDLMVIGQVRYSPARSTDDAHYDPVALALRFERAGVDAISLVSDDPLTPVGMEDLALIARAVRCPLISQDAALDAYQIIEARAGGASAVVLSGLWGEAVDQRALMSLTQRNRMTAIIAVEDFAALDAARSLCPQVIALGWGDSERMRFEHEMLSALRVEIAPETRVLLDAPIETDEDAAAIASLRVNAVLIGAAYLQSTDNVAGLRASLSRASATGSKGRDHGGDANA